MHHPFKLVTAFFVVTQTPLVCAIQSENVALVRLLQDNNVIVNTKNDGGEVLLVLNTL